MFKITLKCTGFPSAVGEKAAADITAEFNEHRPWHENVLCSWVGSELILEAENDVDESGLALLDEFSDCICAYLPPFDREIEIVSVTED